MYLGWNSVTDKWLLGWGTGIRSQERERGRKGQCKFEGSGPAGHRPGAWMDTVTGHAQYWLWVVLLGGKKCTGSGLLQPQGLWLIVYLGSGPDTEHEPKGLKQLTCCQACFSLACGLCLDNLSGNRSLCSFYWACWRQTLFRTWVSAKTWHQAQLLAGLGRLDWISHTLPRPCQIPSPGVLAFTFPQNPWSPPDGVLHLPHQHWASPLAGHRFPAWAMEPDDLVWPLALTLLTNVILNTFFSTSDP